MISIALLIESGAAPTDVRMAGKPARGIPEAQRLLARARKISGYDYDYSKRIAMAEKQLQELIRLNNAS